MARDFGSWMQGRLYADASAALGIIHRLGLGKLRHIDTSALWVQQAARSKLIEYEKVPGELNPADILTKHLAAEPSARHASRCKLEFLAGRPEIAPRVCADELGSIDRIKVEVTKDELEYRRPSGKGIGEREIRADKSNMVNWADEVDK